MTKIILLILLFITGFAQNVSERWYYYGGIAALYGIAEILPDHEPWLSSDIEKQKFPPKETVASKTPVIVGLGLMTALTNPFRANYSSQIDGGNNLLGLFDAMAFEHGVTRIIKKLVLRERPNSEKAKVSFWSGHAAVSFTTAHYISLYLNDYGNISNSAKNLSSASLYCAAAYVAWTRVDDLQHHWSDIIVGSIWGVLASNFIYKIRNEGLYNLYGAKNKKENSTTMFSYSYNF